MCVEVSVCSSLFLHMYLGVYESVGIGTRAVLKTSIGDAVQLCICSSPHILCKNECKCVGKIVDGFVNG